MKLPILNYVRDKVVAQINEPKKWKAKRNMKPSSLGSKCLRKIWYTYRRVTPDYGWTWDRWKNFKKGEAYHDIIKEALEISGLLIPYRNKDGSIPKHWATGLPDKEFPVNAEELAIKNAKIDGVLILKDVPGLTPGLWLSEIKSVNQKKWDNYLKDAPLDDHLAQGTAYLYLMEENLKSGAYSHIPELTGRENEELKGIIYIYVNREDDENDWKEFVVAKNPEVFMKTAQKALDVKAYSDQNILPPKTDDFCPWCEFRDKCAREAKE